MPAKTTTVSCLLMLALALAGCDSETDQVALGSTQGAIQPRGSFVDGVRDPRWGMKFGERQVKTLVGDGSLPLARPRGITPGTDGTLYVTDWEQHVLFRVSVGSWKVSVAAGELGQRGARDGAGGAARFNHPWGVVALGDALYIADTDNAVIRRFCLITAKVETVAGAVGLHGWADGRGQSARFSSPAGITTNGRKLFVADAGNHVIRVVDPQTGAVSTVAGTPLAIGWVDGKAAAATFRMPTGVAVDPDALYIADSGNGVIRRMLWSTGEVKTLAGVPSGYGHHDGRGSQARFAYPSGMASDGDHLFVADTNNQVVRQVSIGTGEVRTIAGSPRVWGLVDGVGDSARFQLPSDVMLLGDDLVVTDLLNRRLRLLSTLQRP